MECCQTVKIENLGTWPTITFNLTDQQVAGHVVYKSVEGLTEENYLYWYPSYGWFIGTDPTTTFIIAANKVTPKHFI